MPAEGLYAPVAYSPWWPWVGVALVLLCAGWVGWVLVHTRSHADPGVPQFIAPRNPEAIKAVYLEKITALQSQYDAGALDGRAAHQGFSAAIRSFVYAMTGIPAQRMTLAELRTLELPQVAEAVAAFYPAEFEAAQFEAAEFEAAEFEAGPASGDLAHARRVADSAALAKAVVLQWS